VAKRAVVKGLYSIHLRVVDGVDGGLTGVMLLNNGRALGAEAFFYYLTDSMKSASMRPGSMELEVCRWIPRLRIAERGAVSWQPGGKRLKW